MFRDAWSGWQNTVWSDAGFYSVFGKNLNLLSALLRPIASLMDCVIFPWQKNYFRLSKHTSWLFVLLSEPPCKAQIHTHTEHTLHILTEHPFFVPWQMWPLAVMVNPECWVWYKQDLVITMILTSVRILLRAPKPRRNKSGIFFSLRFD